MTSLLHLPKDILFVVLSKLGIVELFLGHYHEVPQLRKALHFPSFANYIEHSKDPELQYTLDNIALDNTRFIHPSPHFGATQDEMLEYYTNNPEKDIKYKFFTARGDIDNIDEMHEWNTHYNEGVYFQNTRKPHQTLLDKRDCSPIEGILEHNFERHNTSNLNEDYCKVSDKTTNIEKSLILDDNQKPTNFPNPEQPQPPLTEKEFNEAINQKMLERANILLN